MDMGNTLRVGVGVMAGIAIGVAGPHVLPKLFGSGPKANNPEPSASPAQTISQNAQTQKPAKQNPDNTRVLGERYIVSDGPDNGYSYYFNSSIDCMTGTLTTSNSDGVSTVIMDYNYVGMACNAAGVDSPYADTTSSFPNKDFFKRWQEKHQNIRPVAKAPDSQWVNPVIQCWKGAGGPSDGRVYSKESGSQGIISFSDGGWGARFCADGQEIAACVDTRC